MYKIVKYRRCIFDRVAWVWLADNNKLEPTQLPLYTYTTQPSSSPLTSNAITTITGESFIKQLRSGYAGYPDGRACGGQVSGPRLRDRDHACDREPAGGGQKPVVGGDLLFR